MTYASATSEDQLPCHSHSNIDSVYLLALYKATMAGKNLIQNCSFNGIDCWL